MNTTSKQTLHTIEQIVKPIAIGTNLALLQIIWAMISGRFLTSRGALHSALALSGFSAAEIRCCWRALRHGVWHIGELIDHFRQEVSREGSWQRHQWGGYQPLAADVTAIWRPKLQGWLGTVYRQLLGRRVIGIGFGLVVEVGQIGGQRLPVIRQIIRNHHPHDSEETLKERLLREAARHRTEREVLIHDAGVTLKQVHQLAIERFVIRVASNCTARRNQLPEYRGGRRAEFGTAVRPLPRTWKDRYYEATPADITTTFDLDGTTISALGWHDLMRPDLKVADPHALFTIWVFHDPRFDNPLLVATDLQDASAEVIFRLYQDRWPVEQIPLVAKQLLGCGRQFVFAPASCWRLGELAFLAGNLLSWLALILPPQPTGFWDLHPKKRRAACEGSWGRLFFQKKRWLTPNFGKSGRLPATCPREWLPIGDERRLKPAFQLDFGSYC